jgi:hypothetical protein
MQVLWGLDTSAVWWDFGGVTVDTPRIIHELGQAIAFKIMAGLRYVRGARLRKRQSDQIIQRGLLAKTLHSVGSTAAQISRDFG